MKWKWKQLTKRAYMYVCWLHHRIQKTRKKTQFSNVSINSSFCMASIFIARFLIILFESKHFHLIKSKLHNLRTKKNFLALFHVDSNILKLVSSVLSEWTTILFTNKIFKYIETFKWSDSKCEKSFLLMFA